jgi:hypothetical protein
VPTATDVQQRGQTGRNGRAAAYREFSHQRELEDRERVRGDWIRVDDTDNTIELAETDEPGLLLLRGSYNHGRMTYVTANQVRNLIRAAERDDRVRDLLRA